MIVPYMGFLGQGKDLWRALFTRSRRRVLSLFFGFPERSFYANEVVRLVTVGTGAVQRELVRLSAVGLLTVERRGNQLHYQANPASPFYEELRRMVVKSFGRHAVFREALRELSEEPELALLYGPGLENTEARLKLLLVSESGVRERLQPALKQAANRIGRELDLVLLRPARYRQLLAAEDKELLAVLSSPYLQLLGQLPETPDSRTAIGK